MPESGGLAGIFQGEGSKVGANTLACCKAGMGNTTSHKSNYYLHTGETAFQALKEETG
ncbi:hypothetical protein [Sporofaciens sp. SGI.106]|uniref:hypothetical protein n=1 Tax=Sporofaciens sp. SGI.106 TaxID=3420568 RepID=UPI003CFEBBE8